MLESQTLKTTRTFALSDTVLNKLTNGDHSLPPQKSLRYLITEEIVCAIPASVTIKKDKPITFAQCFNWAQEYATTLPVPCLADFNVNWSLGDWLIIRGNLPHQSHVDAYYGQSTHSVRFNSSFGGFNIVFFRYQTTSSRGQFLCDLYWHGQHPEKIVEACLVDRVDDVAICFRKLSEEPWKKGNSLPDAVDGERLKRVAF